MVTSGCGRVVVISSSFRRRGLLFAVVFGNEREVAILLNRESISIIVMYTQKKNTN